jgi:hypothetical protein
MCEGSSRAAARFSVENEREWTRTYSLLALSCNGVADESCKLHGGCAEVRAKD